LTLGVTPSRVLKGFGTTIQPEPLPCKDQRSQQPGRCVDVSSRRPTASRPGTAAAARRTLPRVPTFGLQRIVHEQVQAASLAARAMPAHGSWAASKAKPLNMPAMKRRGLIARRSIVKASSHEGGAVTLR
jgi:hypothetical protein